MKIKDKETIPNDGLDDKESISGDSLQDAFSEITGSMPEISQHVVNLQHEEAANPPLNQPQNSKPEETPKKTRGRPKKDANQAGQTTSKIGARPISQQLQQNQMMEEQKKRLAVAVGAASQLVQTSGFILAGAEARYLPEEKLMIDCSFENYFMAKGITDFPPGIALAFGLFGYYTRISATPPAQSKIKFGFAWIKMKTSSLFSRKIKNASYVNSRNDNERENNAGEKAGA